MLSENDINNIIQKVLSEIDNKKKKSDDKSSFTYEENIKASEEEDIADFTAIDPRGQLLVENPENKDAYLKYKSKTSARVGIGRTGPRYKTETLLKFRADHAIAQDAVFTDVTELLLEEMELFSVKTMCTSKDEYLTRPDLGRRFDAKAIQTIKEKSKRSPQVQVYISDGLSSTAIEENARDTFAAIMQGLAEYKISVGTPFFVKYGRVPAMDAIAEILDPQVTVVLIGERPGLATAGSMSCYMAYKASVGMPEANRTVISNIHKDGTTAVEAGAHIADVIRKILEQKTSGVNLKL